jgi:hypothetical protein
LVRSLDAMRASPWATAGVAVVLAFTGCGGDDEFANDAPDPVPLHVSAAITPVDVTVSPARLGAGPIELVASNLTSTPQRLTLRGRSLTGGGRPLEQRTGPIDPGDRASLAADLAPGTYRVTTSSAAIASATLRVGPARQGGQGQLLQP